MIKAVIFDFFGVVQSDAYNSWLTAHGLKREGVYIEISRLQDKGEITGDEFFTRLSRASGVSVTMNDFDVMRTLNQGTIAILQALRGRYRTAVLSNSPVGHLRRILAQDNLEQYFDEIVVSGEVQMIKPSPEIFRFTLERLKVQPDEAVFIDDNESNVAGAEEIGIHGIHFKSSEQLVIDLRQLSVGA